jgi:hypothetical protein
VLVLTPASLQGQPSTSGTFTGVISGQIKGHAAVSEFQIVVTTTSKMPSTAPLAPTYYGHIASTQDALLLFEACLSGALNHVARRPHDRERASLIQSGNVLIYEEHSSGIKRWTDGVPWSPSRILGNFLVYRELERPFPPGEKKRAMKRSKRSPGISKAPEPYGVLSNGMSHAYHAGSAAASTFDFGNSNSLSKETERSLIGSLVDSYGFKEDGLVKKTVSVTAGGISHHLVSYYTVADVMNNKFTTPTKDPRFQHLTPRADLLTKQNFRAPLDEVDNLDRIDDRSVYNNYPYARSGYEVTNQSIVHRQISVPTPSLNYPQISGLFSNYTIAPSPGYGDGTSSYGSHAVPAPKPESYDTGGYKPPRYNPLVSINSDSNRSQIPLAITNFARRTSNYGSSGSIDSGASVNSAGSNDSKYTNDSGYSSAAFDGTLKDSPNGQHNYTAQRSLPTPTMHNPYERHATNSYGHLDNPAKPEHMWSMGNTSAGHAHYLTPQTIPHPQWASTGIS